GVKPAQRVELAVDPQPLLDPPAEPGFVGDGARRPRYWHHAAVLIGGPVVEIAVRPVTIRFDGDERCAACLAAAAQKHRRLLAALELRKDIGDEAFKHKRFESHCFQIGAFVVAMWRTRDWSRGGGYWFNARAATLVRATKMSRAPLTGLNADDIAPM